MGVAAGPELGEGCKVKSQKRPHRDDDENSDEEIALRSEDKLGQAVSRLISTHIVFMADKGGADSALAQQLSETQALKFQAKDRNIPAGKGCCLIIVDPANMTESTSHPHLRKAQVPQQIIDRAANVGLMARAITRTGVSDIDPAEMFGTDDVWLLFDGGRQIENVLLKPFRKATSKTKVPITLTYDEDSMLANIGRVTVMGSLRCTETMYLLAAAEWSCPRRAHLHYKGSNYSDQLGPIMVDSWEADTTWKMPRKEKKAMMGRFKIEAGGAVDAGLASTSKWKLREEEPVWFHQKPYALCEEFAHSYFAKSIVDFSPAGGQFALVAMRKRIPYVGITCSEAHSAELLKHLQTVVRAAMTDPEDSLYKADLDTASPPAKTGKKGTTPTPTPPKKPKPEPEPTGPNGPKQDLMNKLKDLMKNGAGKDDGDEDDTEEDALWRSTL